MNMESAHADLDVYEAVHTVKDAIILLSENLPAMHGGGHTHSVMQFTALIQRLAAASLAVHEVASKTRYQQQAIDQLSDELRAAKLQVQELEVREQTTQVATRAYYTEVTEAMGALQELRDQTGAMDTYRHSLLGVISDLLGKLVPDGVDAGADPAAPVVNADLRASGGLAGVEVFQPPEFVEEPVVGRDRAGVNAQLRNAIENLGSAITSASCRITALEQASSLVVVPPAHDHLPGTDTAITSHFAPGAGGQMVVGVVDALGHLHWTVAGSCADGFSQARQVLVRFADSPDAVSLVAQALE